MSDPFTLHGRLALVIGAGRGIGRGCATALAAAGAEVVLFSRTRSELEDLAAEIQATGGVAHVYCGDAGEEEALADAVAFSEQRGDLRVLVTAAGTNRVGPTRSYATADWDALFDLNVRATFLACRMVGGSLLRREAPGSIVTISSQMGLVGYPERAAYCASKHAVNGLTKALAVEWAPAGVRVNAVAPTFVETSLTMGYLEDEEFRREVLERRLPTRRLASVQDVAHAVRYLACDASASVTGHILAVDGGWTAW